MGYLAHVWCQGKLRWLVISEQILTLASCCDPFVNSIPLDSIGCSVSLGIQQFHIQSHTRRCVLLKLPPHASLTPFIEILWFKVFEDLLTYSKRLVRNALGSLQPSLLGTSERNNWWYMSWWYMSYFLKNPITILAKDCLQHVWSQSRYKILGCQSKTFVKYIDTINMIEDINVPLKCQWIFRLYRNLIMCPRLFAWVQVTEAFALIVIHPQFAADSTLHHESV